MDREQYRREVNRGEVPPMMACRACGCTDHVVDGDPDNCPECSPKVDEDPIPREQIEAQFPGIFDQYESPGSDGGDA